MKVDLDRIAAEQAPSVARQLLMAAGRRGTEADFRREAAQIFAEASRDTGLTIVPRDEFSVARGRVDSVYNRLVIEYERPGRLTDRNAAAGNSHAIQQVKDYIEGVATKEKREAHRLAGVATDGFFFVFVRRVGEGWDVEDPHAVNPASTERLLRLLFALASGAALVPEVLVEDFGPRHIRAQRAVRALYRAAARSAHPLVAKLFEQWRQFFSEATDYKEWAERIESKPEFRSFVGSLWKKEEVKHLDAARVFFVLHTYYALLIKLVASMAAGRFAGKSTRALSALASLEGNELQEAFRDIERGGIFAQYGIRNFLEGDFFGWYLAAWDGDIEEAVGSMVARLAEYDPGTLELAPENARDLLKKLYHYLLPREIRHDLGEYYTPDWLAERTIRQTLGSDLGDATKRVLDPACGSGTFLVLLIHHIKERAARKNRDPATTLGQILQNVVGFDLNPLAVIAARTNYLLALGELLQHRRSDINIPVYQADSVLTPSQGNDLYDGNVFPLRTSVGEFRVPVTFAERERMDALADVLDEGVGAGWGDRAFLTHLSKAVALDDEAMESAESDLKALFKQMKNLHDEGLNGVWARIIKNSFSPLFLEPCHYVVGNPPWVNWEHLPEEYRRSTISLWKHYGLFPKRDTGLETILGGAKYDIAMLMAYVSADRYLRNRGRLGFVITQTVFKTSGAGQGFRRFILPDGTGIAPSSVDDMIELKPFEGAANRTAVVVLAKGRTVRYPIPYSYWVKKFSGRGSALGFDTPYEEISKEKVTYKSWFAEPVDEQDETSGWITATKRILMCLRRMHGRSSYVARKGVYSSANGVFWIEVIGVRPGGQLIVGNVTEGAKIKIPKVQAGIEPALVYPLLRGSDVASWWAVPSISILVTHEQGMRLKAIPEATMQNTYPKAWAYLVKYRDRLRKTGLFRRFCKDSDPFYSMFDIGDYTFSPWKLVIREVAAGLTAAVIGPVNGRPVIPDHKLVIVATKSDDEAHFLCAMLNSIPARLFVGSYCIETQFSSHIFTLLKVPTFISALGSHRRLVKLSKKAHCAAAAQKVDDVHRIEEEINREAAPLWGLSQAELTECRQFLDGT